MNESYYGHPVLRKAHWRWEIETYFWLGGIASGSAALATLADRAGDKGDAALVRTGRYLALAGAGASTALLIKDLSRPERFLNMLRIVKFGSPMSVGVWTLVSFSFAATLSAMDQLQRDGIIEKNPVAFVPRLVRDGLFACAGAILGSYTGVLISATAIPVWYEGRHHIPAIFVSSALATACAANALPLALGGRVSTVRKLERLESLASLAELALLVDYARRAGDGADALFGGDNGHRLKRWTMFAGAVVPLALNCSSWFRRGRSGHSRARSFPLKTVMAAALTLYGGLVLRRCILEAGRRSADDPKPVLRRR